MWPFRVMGSGFYRFFVFWGVEFRGLGVWGVVFY